MSGKEEKIGAHVPSRALAALRICMSFLTRLAVSLVALSFSVLSGIDAQITMHSSPVMIYCTAGTAIFGSAFIVGSHEAWHRRARLWSALLAIVGIALIASSMTLSLGGVATVKDALKASNRTKQANAELDLSRRQEVTNELAELRKVTGGETAEMLRPAVGAFEASSIFTRSSGCSDRSLASTKRHCSGLDDVRRRLAAAERIAELEHKRAGWSETIESAPLSADPQIENVITLANDLHISISEQSTRATLNAAYIIGLELIAAFGPLMAFAWGRTGQATRQAAGHLKSPVLHEGMTPEKTLLSIENSPVLPALIQDESWAPQDTQDRQAGKTPVRSPEKPVLAPMASLGDVAQWAEDSIEMAAGGRMQSSPLHQTYSAWCEARGRKPVNAYAFGLTMKELGWKKDRIGGKVLYLDLAMKKQALKVVK